MDVIFIIVIFFVVMNILGFASMGIDKWKAIKDKWRISEKALLTSAFILGAPGSILGSLYFHHKTS